ncbi:Uu.00g077070.m01.CDS01 [Anthostomella pinea]|uniref:N-acetylgalactosaminide beta-1,3-galactosyltransferase n=1 Tax=Anthostomella pinea TaxID=933095 RepID=A0AAI8VVY2_9PEZI|nr:Uu.00g077070.m01.CDS01 [Anthostomella pinea]
MMFSRQTCGSFALTTVCFFFLFLTAKRLGEWSLNSPYSRVVPSFRYPHGQAGANSTAWDGSAVGAPHLRPYDPVCDSFPNTSNILVVVKTGATESYTKIPMQLMTNLRCVSDFLIFSDLRQNIAGYEIRDSLDNVLAETKHDNPDFNLYQRQQACPIDQESCGLDDHLRSEGWDLDKYKNIHIAEKTYQLRPNYEWYLFIDADSYVVMPSLVQWLRKLDSSKELYFGSVSLIDGLRFAHGGSGYLLSQAAMHKFVGSHPGIANQYDTRIRESCCGDHMLAIAINETIGLKVKQTWPTINGEKPHTIPFRSQQWCQPIVTMHHMDPEEMSSF